MNYELLVAIAWTIAVRACDAFILASLVGDPSVTPLTLEHALEAYEHVRLPPANHVLTGSRESGRMYEFVDEYDFGDCDQLRVGLPLRGNGTGCHRTGRMKIHGARSCGWKTILTLRNSMSLRVVYPIPPRTLPKLSFSANTGLIHAVERLSCLPPHRRERDRTSCQYPRALREIDDRMRDMMSDEPGRIPFTSTHRVLDVAQRQICAESRGAFVGPMDPRDFLDASVPPPPLREDGRERVMPAVSFKALKDVKTEVEMYPIYIFICQKLDEEHIMD
ncbi:hypothetical protein EVG20_g11048, partial [Dentipellis fragilis]